MSEAARGMTAEELAAEVGGRVVSGGGPEVRVSRVASVEAAGHGDVTFVEDAKLFDAARASRASCLIAPPGSGLEGPACVIEAERPKLAFALAAAALRPRAPRAAGVHPTARVADGARLGAGAHVGEYVVIEDGAEVGEGAQVLAGVYVGAGVRVGRDCVLHPGVVLYEGVTLGERVTLHANVVVGADGFGYVRDAEGVYHKFPQVGTVVVEDDVEVGANTCIDRGALGETRVGRGTKIDNLVQVAHNVRIGERVVIAAQTGISGSTVIESDAVIGGQVGMGDHARVLSGAVIGSQAGVLPGKIVRPGVWWGTPVRPLEEYKRLNALWLRLPRMREEVEELKRQVRELQSKIDGGGQDREDSDSRG